MRFQSLICFTLAVLGILFTGGCAQKEVKQDNPVPFYDTLDKGLLDTMKLLSQAGYFDLDLGEDCSTYVEKGCVYQNFWYFHDMLDAESLQLFFNEKDSYLKAYAFAALHFKKPAVLFDIVQKSLPDTSQLVVKEYGDTSMLSLPGVYLRFIARYHSLSAAQKRQLEGLILKEYTFLEHVPAILMGHQPDKEFYPVIRQMVSSGNQPLAIVALAKYGQAADSSIILESIRENLDPVPIIPELFLAIEHYPGTGFFNFMLEVPGSIAERDIRVNHELQYYFRALASYRSSRCVPVFRYFLNPSLYTSDRVYRVNQKYILKALHDYHCPAYDDLYRELKEEMPVDYLKRLHANDLPSYRW